MTRSSKSSNVSQPCSRVSGVFSAAAVSIFLLFLYLQNSSFAGDLPSSEPQGSWRLVHLALGFSPGISSTTHREQTATQPPSGNNLPLRLVDSGSNLEPTKDKAHFLRDFTAALQSVSGRPKQSQ